MPVDTWLAFFVASSLIFLGPGAGAVSCMSAGMRFGFRPALWNRAVGGLFVAAGAFLATFRRAL